MPSRKKPIPAAAPPPPPPPAPDPISILTSALYGFDPAKIPPERLERARADALVFVTHYSQGYTAEKLAVVFMVSVEAAKRTIKSIHTIISENPVADAMLGGITQRVDRIDGILNKLLATVTGGPDPLALATGAIDTWLAETPGRLRVGLSAALELRDRFANVLLGERNALTAVLIPGFPSTGGRG